MKKLTIYILIIAVLILTALLSCSEKSTTEPESAVYNASGTWAFIFTQTKVLDGDYSECGTRPVPQRSFEIIQDGNDVSLVDKNGELVNGSVIGASYEFNFRELENINDEDYIDFHLEFQLSSDTSCSGTYRMDERTFFSADSFFCITEGSLAGSNPTGTH